MRRGYLKCPCGNTVGPFFDHYHESRHWRALAFTLGALLVVSLCALKWASARPSAPAAGPLDVKVVPLDPTVIRASRAAPVWL